MSGKFPSQLKEFGWQIWHYYINLWQVLSQPNLVHRFLLTLLHPGGGRSGQNPPRPWCILWGMQQPIPNFLTFPNFFCNSCKKNTINFFLSHKHRHGLHEHDLSRLVMNRNLPKYPYVFFKKLPIRSLHILVATLLKRKGGSVLGLNILLGSL